MFNKNKKMREIKKIAESQDGGVRIYLRYYQSCGSLWQLVTTKKKKNIKLIGGPSDLKLIDKAWIGDKVLGGCIIIKGVTFKRTSEAISLLKSTEMQKLLDKVKEYKNEGWYVNEDEIEELETRIIAGELKD